MKYKIEIESDAEFEEIKRLLVEHFQNFKLESEKGKYLLGSYKGVEE